MYDKKWGHYRIRFLAVNKQCYACGKSSEVVDHLVPHKGCPVLFKDLHNHIPLCARCHNTVTTKFDRNFKKGDSMTPKIKWFVEERLFNEVDVRVKVLPEY